MRGSIFALLLYAVLLSFASAHISTSFESTLPADSTDSGGDDTSPTVSLSSVSPTESAFDEESNSQSTASSALPDESALPASETSSTSQDPSSVSATESSSPTSEGAAGGASVAEASGNPDSNGEFAQSPVQTDESEQLMSSGTIAGITIACAAVVAALIGGLVLFLRRRYRKPDSEQRSVTPTSPPFPAHPAPQHPNRDAASYMRSTTPTSNYSSAEATYRAVPTSPVSPSTHTTLTYHNPESRFSRTTPIQAPMPLPPMAPGMSPIPGFQLQSYSQYVVSSPQGSTTSPMIAAAAIPATSSIAASSSEDISTPFLNVTGRFVLAGNTPQSALAQARKQRDSLSALKQRAKFRAMQTRRSMDTPFPETFDSDFEDVWKVSMQQAMQKRAELGGLVQMEMQGYDPGVKEVFYLDPRSGSYFVFVPECDVGDGRTIS